MAIDKNSVINEAQKFVAKGQYDKAIAEWQKLLQESPHDANIYNTIGDLCLKKNARDEAVESYKLAADILAGDGFTSKAIALYKKILNIDKNRIDVHLALGDMNAQKGLVGNALENYKYAADHFTKKNQAAEALGVYRKMADLNPSNVAFRIKLADMYAGRGMQAWAEQVLQSARELDPANREVLARLGLAPLEPGPPVEAAGSVPEQIETLQPIVENFPPDVPSAPLTPPASETTAPVFEEALPAQEPAATEELAFEVLDADIPPLDEEAPIAEPGTPAFIGESAPQTPPSEEQLETPESAPEPAEDAVPGLQNAGEPPAGADESDLRAEAEFYYQQGLFNEAKRRYATVLELNPGEKQATLRLAEITREEQDAREFAKLTEAVDGLEEALSAGPAGQELPLSESDEDAVRGLMKEITELEYRAKEPAGSGRSAPPDAGPAGPVDAEDFFDLGAELAAEDEADTPRTEEEQAEGYFDLASELKDEFGGDAAPALPSSGDELSLDEIFEEFKRGVESQSAKEDIDAHYNLGVAYKEMGLLNDAIEEFTLTSEDEPKYAQSRYMLGLCYLEMGDYHRAIEELQNALDFSESLGGDESSRIGMHYDLGLACQGAGDLRGALAEFQKVSGLDPLYQDTATKLTELAHGDYISLAQLKDEIEKEISEKFLIEGERIEREEKNRNSDKARNL